MFKIVDNTTIKHYFINFKQKKIYYKKNYGRKTRPLSRKKKKEKRIKNKEKKKLTLNLSPFICGSN